MKLLKQLLLMSTLLTFVNGEEPSDKKVVNNGLGARVVFLYVLFEQLFVASLYVFVDIIKMFGGDFVQFIVDVI